MLSKTIQDCNCCYWLEKNLRKWKISFNLGFACLMIRLSSALKFSWRDTNITLCDVRHEMFFRHCRTDTDNNAFWDQAHKTRAVISAIQSYRSSDKHNMRRMATAWKMMCVLTSTQWVFQNRTLHKGVRIAKWIFQNRRSAVSQSCRSLSVDGGIAPTSYVASVAHVSVLNKNVFLIGYDF